MRIMLVADKQNSKFYGQARGAIDGHTIIVPKNHYNLLSLYLSRAKKYNCDAIVLSNCEMLVKLVKEQTGKTVELYRNKRRLVPSHDWAGAVFVKEGVKIIISRPFRTLVTTGYARFLLSWYVNKALSPAFIKTPEMNWDIATPTNIKNHYDMFKKAVYIAVDIETTIVELDQAKVVAMGDRAKGVVVETKPTKTSKRICPCAVKIDMIGYCGLFLREDGTLYSHSIVLHINSMEDVQWMRSFNSLPAPKICQNGGYEATHLIRYNAPLYNWICDTFHFMHSWYAELPRTLDFIASLFMTDYQYWKDEMQANRAEYNAKDTHNTLWSWLVMVNMAPQWAKDNYLIEFRKCFPNITCGLEGFKVDYAERDRLIEECEKEIQKAQARLDIIIYEGFNPSSPKQVLEVMNALSVAKFKSSDDKALVRFSEKGPIEALITELIKQVRKYGKRLSTLKTTLYEGRLLYEISAGGTDTGRSASKASNLWCGTQIQNQDTTIRSMYISDSDSTMAHNNWRLANCDGSQAESRTTAYISEDATLIDTVENAKDFHSKNASLFFGVPEDEIVKVVYETITVDGAEVQQPLLDANGEVVKDKSLRNLAKRVNHGSNYNMGPGVLLDTMGTKNVISAKALLNLPTHMGLLQVCEFLLSTFEHTYPQVKGKYYDEVIEEIRITSRLKGATGWTRYCFELPSRTGNKLVLNKYVAHAPQSLSVMLVDEALFDFWYEWQIQKNKVRVKAQVHDEIVYMVRENDYKETKPALAELMARPITVKDRELIIPNDGGGIGYRWSDLKD